MLELLERVNMSGIKDHDVLGGEKGQVSHAELTHLTELTPEERVIEKKLRRKIDGMRVFLGHSCSPR